MRLGVSGAGRWARCSGLCKGPEVGAAGRVSGTGGPTRLGRRSHEESVGRGEGRPGMSPHPCVRVAAHVPPAGARGSPETERSKAVSARSLPPPAPAPRRDTGDFLFPTYLRPSPEWSGAEAAGAQPSHGGPLHPPHRPPGLRKALRPQPALREYLARGAGAGPHAAPGPRARDAGGGGAKAPGRGRGSPSLGLSPPLPGRQCTCAPQKMRAATPCAGPATWPWPTHPAPCSPNPLRAPQVSLQPLWEGVLGGAGRR